MVTLRMEIMYHEVQSIGQGSQRTIGFVTLMQGQRSSPKVVGEDGSPMRGLAIDILIIDL